MEYDVVLTADAEEDLDRFVRYLLFEKKNEQAASNVLNDFEATKQSLARVAGSLKLCDNPKLRELGYEPKYDVVKLFENFKEEMKVDRFLELRGK